MLGADACRPGRPHARSLATIRSAIGVLRAGKGVLRVRDGDDVLAACVTVVTATGRVTQCHRDARCFLAPSFVESCTVLGFARVDTFHQLFEVVGEFEICFRPRLVQMRQQVQEAVNNRQWDGYVLLHQAET